MMMTITEKKQFSINSTNSSNEAICSTDRSEFTNGNGTTIHWIADFLNETIPYEVVRQPSPCRCEGAQILIGVISDAANTEMRDAIRDTYANANRSRAIKNGIVSVIFVVGTPNARTRFEMILKESDQHKDLLITTIAEHYSNLPLKVHSLLQYKNVLCEKVQFVGKTDDDVVVDVDRLTYSLHRFRRPRAIFGYLYDDSHPIRDRLSKWYVPHERYSEGTYPIYVGGLFYLITSDVVDAILKSIPLVRLIHIEDVIFTGIAASIANVQRIDERRSFALIEGKRFPERWLCDTANVPYLIAEHDRAKFDAELFRSKYDKLTHINCSALPFPLFYIICQYFGKCYW